MKVKVKNLGPLRQAEFEVGDLTIICGGNNTGKTYATYALYGFLSFWHSGFSLDVPHDIVAALLREGTVSIAISERAYSSDVVLRAAADEYSKQLHVVLAAPKERFADTSFSVQLSADGIRPASTFRRRMRAADADLFMLQKEADSDELVVTLLAQKDTRIPHDVVARIIGDALKDIIYDASFPRGFIASAERTGAAIFSRELNFARNRLLEQMSLADASTDPLDLLSKAYQGYALPVQENVDFTRQITGVYGQTSELVDAEPDVLSGFEEILGGSYLVTKDGSLYFVPSATRMRLTMGEGSSAVRSLLDLGFYLRHVARRGDLLMIDEPELNLHPCNQRRLARLLARLVNFGIRVFVTTHSDYIIREMNTLILLQPRTSGLAAIAKAEGYSDRELLDPTRIRAYIAETALVLVDGKKRQTRCHTLVPCRITAETGIDAHTFNEDIEDLNRIQDEIVWGIGRDG